MFAPISIQSRKNAKRFLFHPKVLKYKPLSRFNKPMWKDNLRPYLSFLVKRFNNIIKVQGEDLYWIATIREKQN